MTIRIVCTVTVKIIFISEEEKMKILLTHANAKDNKGDAAFINVLLRQPNIAFPGANIIISTYDDDT